MKIITQNTNSFTEAEGSPQESGDQNGIRATRIFRGPSEDRFQFIRDITSWTYYDGIGDEILVHNGVPYPDNPALLPTSWSIRNEGVPVQVSNGGPVTDLSEVVRSYCQTGYDCEITVEYTQSSDDDQGAGGKSDARLPNKPEGTLLTVSEVTSTEHVPVEVRGGEIGENANLGFAPSEAQTFDYPVAVHEITWSWKGVQAPPFDKIRNYQTKLNWNEFWGYPRGAVLFTGASVRTVKNIVGQTIYDLEYRFVAKTIPAFGYATAPNLNPDLVKDDRLGWYNRTWNDKPLPGTYQHWWFSWNVDPPGNIAQANIGILSPSENFSDLVSYGVVPS